MDFMKNDQYDRYGVILSADHVSKSWNGCERAKMYTSNGRRNLIMQMQALYHYIDADLKEEVMNKLQTPAWMEDGETAGKNKKDRFNFEFLIWSLKCTKMKNYIHI